MFARKLLDAKLPNVLWNTLFYVSLSFLFTFFLINQEAVKWKLLVRFPLFFPLPDKLPTLSMTSEEDGHCVSMFYMKLSFTVAITWHICCNSIHQMVSMEHHTTMYFWLYCTLLY